MRSTQSARRCRPSPSVRAQLTALARVIDEATVDDPGHVLIHVVEDGDEIELGLRSLEVDVHPFNELAGCTGPPEWSMFGLRVRGTAHRLDADGPSHASTTTFLMHRCGEERSLLRRGADVEEVSSRAQGTLPDLCRRVLGLPTDPAPPTSAALWSVAWLDRILERWGDPHQRGALGASWPRLASLHPALDAVGGAEGRYLDDPAQLLEVGRAHTAAWPWARLRAQPDGLRLPDGHLPREITQWMDDGFYARWAMGAFPHPATLAHDLSELVDDDVGAHLLVALEGLLA